MRQRKEYATYAKVLPLAQYLKVKVPSKWYRRGVGATEILCGFCLAFVPSSESDLTHACPTFAVRETDVSRHNGGHLGCPP